MTNKYIRCKDFYDAFIKEWSLAVKNKEFYDGQPYENTKSWNKYMLRHNGFVNRVMNCLESSDHKLTYKTEWYTVDALYVSGEDLFRKNLSYPSDVEVLIEHEMGNNIEEEMWKLLYWRAPLKVIIGYDWSEEEKTTQLRREWSKRKIAKLKKMLSSVNNFFSENIKTEYLFLIAARYKANGPLIWWADSNNEFKVNPTYEQLT